MDATIKTTIDAAGRVVIPKVVRDLARLRAGTVLEIRVREGVIEIEPLPLAVRVERRGNLTVAVPVEPVPPLSAESVERTRERIGDERGRRGRRR